MDFEIVTAVFSTLGIPPPSKLILLEAGTLQSAHVPPYPPDCPALLSGVGSRIMASQLTDVLGAIYPQEHVVQVIGNGQMAEMKIAAVGDFQNYSEETCIFVPPLNEG